MNENINLCEILKDCPNGTEFWSPLFNKVTFCGLRDDYKYPIIVKLSDYSSEVFMSNGYFSENNDECLLFPSKDQRDWSKWKCPKPKFDPKTLQPFDKVLVRGEGKDDKWTCNLFAFYDDDTGYCFECLNDVYEYCVPYNEETKHLVGTSEEAPEYYRYWEE